MNDHKEHLDEIAQTAATLYGQSWPALPQWTKDRWRETVRHTARGAGGVNQMEFYAGQAIDEWYKGQEAQEAPQITTTLVAEIEPVETLEASPKQKSKKK